MTLLEVVVAFVVLMVVLVPIALVLDNTIGQAASSRDRLTALSVAEQYIDRLNNTPLDKTSTTRTPTRNETTDNTTLPIVDQTIEQTSTPLVRSTVGYSVYARFTWALHENSSQDLCTAGTAPTLLDLQVTVEWGSAPQKLTDTTMIDYPLSGILTEGFLAIKVEGNPAGGPPVDARTHPWSTRVKAVPVTIKPGTTVTGYTTTTRYPNKYGCVFEEVPPGKYTVSVADPSPGTPAGTDYGTPSWVANYDEELTDTSSADVTAGDVTTVPFTYDEGSLVDLTYPSTTAAEGDVTCPGAGSILCMAAGQSPLSTTKPSSTARADLSVLTSSGWAVYRPGPTRLAATACAGSRRCISVGYKQTGSSLLGASVSTATGAVQFVTDSVPSGVTGLSAITCPSTSKCYAYGEGSSSSSAAILSATVATGALSWQLDGGLSGITAISSFGCASATTCYAIASTSSETTEVLSLTGTTWTKVTLPTSPSTVSAVSQLTCQSGACFVLGTSSSSKPLILSRSSSTASWIEDSFTVTPTSVAAIQCPSASECYATGIESSAHKILSIKTDSPTAVKWTTDSISSVTLTALTMLECPGTTTCYATGRKSATVPVIISLSGPTTWTADTLPTALDADSDWISGLTCPSTSQCDATGIATVHGSSGAVVISLSSATEWTDDTLPSGVSPVYLAGIACTATDSKCAALGASPTGAVFLSATLSARSWSDGTPSGLTGMYLDDTPISVSNPDLKPTTTVEVASPTPNGDVSTVGPLFPFASGYQVAAAGCSGQVTETAAAIKSVPGAGATSQPAAALTMGLLPIEVETTAGLPVSDATVTAKLTCTRLTAPKNETNRTSFALQSTGPAGMSEMDVMYGKYVVTVKSGATSKTATVTVSPTETTAVVSGVTTTRLLPTPVVVKL